MWQSELAIELNAAAPGERKGILASYAGRTGRSPAQLYRIAAKHGFESGRKTRGDKGTLKCGLVDTQIDYVAALVKTSSRDRKGAILIVKDALEIAFDNDIIERGQVTPETMTRILRERQINAEALGRERPHTEMRSLHPNHVHLVDVSVCIQYYLRNGKGGILRESEYMKRTLQGKVKSSTRLLRYVLVDHFSGCLFVDYFDAQGETSVNLYTFLKCAWGRKENHEKYPFHGVPSILLMDRGSANISKSITNFLVNKLGIEIPEGMPRNKQRQGAVEVAQNIVERRFESKLAFHPAETLEDLRGYVANWLPWYNATQNHTRHGETRTAYWVSHTRAEHLRELPPIEILEEAYAEPEQERTVGGAYEISFKGEEYRLKHVEGLFRGAKVKVVLMPMKWPAVDVVYNGRVYEAAPFKRLSAAEGAFPADAAIIGREYKAPPETLTQQAEKRMDALAYGTERKQNDVPFAGITVHNIHTEKLGNLAFMQKEGAPIEVDRGVTERHISFIELLKRLHAEAGSITTEMNAALREEYGDSIEIEKAEEVIQAVKEGRWPESDAGRRMAQAI